MPSSASAWRGASSHLLPESEQVSAYVPHTTQASFFSFLSTLHCLHKEKHLSPLPRCSRTLFRHTAPSSAVFSPPVIACLCHRLYGPAGYIFDQHPVITFISLSILHSMLSQAHTHSTTHITTHTCWGGGGLFIRLVLQKVEFRILDEFLKFDTEIIILV